MPELDMKLPKTAGWEDCLDVGGSDLFAKARALQPLIAREEAANNHFFRRPILVPGSGHAIVRDPSSGEAKDVIMLGSNSYLGLHNNSRVVAASIAAAQKYGYGTGSVSLYAGTTDLHLELEAAIARFYRCEDAILFPTGYAANVGVISALLRERDLAIGDLFNHASIYDGCTLSGAQLRPYAHRRMRRLERALKEGAAQERGMLVITDGVFSMEGSVAPLDRIHALAQANGARVMIDEAHALGVIGPTGRGTAEQFGLEGAIDITVGTLSKVPGAIGGYAVGSKAVIDYMRFYARTYFFSTSIPTPVVAGLLKVFEILSDDLSLHTALWKNITYLKTGIEELGYDSGDSASAIVPVIVRDEEKVKALLRDLFTEGIFTNYVAFPAVPKRRARLRLGVMAQHTREDLDRTLTALARLGKRHGIL